MRKIILSFILFTLIFLQLVFVSNAQIRSTWVIVTMLVHSYEPKVPLTNSREYQGQKILFDAITIEDKNLPGIKFDYI